jgi:predicted nucleotidyltransferase
MEQINKKLTEKQQIFFNNLSIYIDKPLYFYGSIIRDDYLPGKSDIDIDIFTDNESSTIQMLCNYLNLNKSNFRKSFFKINSTIVRGYKSKYKDDNNNIETELSVYNNKYKNLVLEEHSRCMSLPIYISILLIIVKILYYNLNFISNDSYRICKQYLMNKGGEFKFILVDN